MNLGLSVLRSVVQVHEARVRAARRAVGQAAEQVRRQTAAWQHASQLLQACQAACEQIERAGPAAVQAGASLSPGHLLAHLAQVEMARQKVSAQAGAVEVEQQTLVSRRGDELLARRALGRQEQTLQKWRGLLDDQQRLTAMAIEDQAEEDLIEGMAGAAVVRQQEGADGPVA